MAKEKILTESANPGNSILIYIERLDDNEILNKGYGFRNSLLEPVSSNDQFRIASSTKIFVSIVILQLIEEGKISLKSKVSEYLNSINHLDFKNFHLLNGKSFANQITIAQLLSHRSGLADIFTDKEEDFFKLVLQNMQQQYTPQDIIKLYFQFGLNTNPHFKPGKGWRYSDMNYVLLGSIIELIDKMSLAKSIRSRILDPLNMENTFFEFYESPSKKDNRIEQYIGDINMTEINTSFDWAGGGLVSNNTDLAKFIKALFDFKLINASSLNKMIDVQFTKEHENRYGLGVWESVYNGDIYYGHYGFYGTYIGFCPEKRIVISYCISQAETKFNIYSFVNDIVKLTE
ncbi:MAG: serine hydrolase domain-containing protein [Aurantibacter sp.]